MDHRENPIRWQTIFSQSTKSDLGEIFFFRTVFEFSGMYQNNILILVNFYKKKSIYERKYYTDKLRSQIFGKYHILSDKREKFDEIFTIINDKNMDHINEIFNRKRMISLVIIILKNIRFLRH